MKHSDIKEGENPEPLSKLFSRTGLEHTANNRNDPEVEGSFGTFYDMITNPNTKKIDNKVFATILECISTKEKKLTDKEYVEKLPPWFNVKYEQRTKKNETASIDEQLNKLEEDVNSKPQKAKERPPHLIA